MHRRGYSLIEMIVVLTIGAVIVGISVGALHALLRTERTGRDRVPQSGILARLAERFRGDVGAAVQQTSNAQQGEWQFALAGDRVVTYRMLPGEVRWAELMGGKMVRQESYVLPTGCSAAITVQSEAMPPLASLVVKNDSTSLAASREMRIMAVLGKDHRFAQSSVGGQ